MTGRGLSIGGAALLLASPALYEGVYELGLSGHLPTLYPPTEWQGCCSTSYQTRPHEVPAALLAFAHLAALVAFFDPRRSAPPLIAMSLFIPAQLAMIPGLGGPLCAPLWVSALVPAVVVGSLIGIERAVDRAAGVARISMPLLLAQTHLLIWSSWEGHPLLAGAWVGLLGALLWAVGEMIASRRPASSASAWRSCPLPSRRTSWRRA